MSDTPEQQTIPEKEGPSDNPNTIRQTLQNKIKMTEKEIDKFKDYIASLKE